MNGKGRKQRAATAEEKRMVLKYWLEYVKLGTIAELVGLHRSTVGHIIHKAMTDGIIEERRIYHEQKR